MSTHHVLDVEHITHTQCSPNSVRRVLMFMTVAIRGSGAPYPLAASPGRGDRLAVTARLRAPALLTSAGHRRRLPSRLFFPASLACSAAVAAVAPTAAGPVHHFVAGDVQVPLEDAGDRRDASVGSA